MASNLRVGTRSSTYHWPAVKPFARASKLDRLLCWGSGFALTIWIASSCLNEPWLDSFFQTVILVIAAVTMFRSALAGAGSKLKLSICASFVLPLVGIGQLLLGRAAYAYATLLATMNWFTFAALLYLGSELMKKRQRLDEFFRVASFIGTCVTLLELYQLFVLGRYHVTSTGMPLMSSNFYAEFAELVLPIILFPLFRSTRNDWHRIALVSMMVATVIASAARVGTALVLVEVVVIWIFARSRVGRSNLSSYPLLSIGVLVLALGAVEGAGTLQNRLMETQPLAHRSQILSSAFLMIRARPIAGWGLGSFDVIYPEFQSYESEYFVNHVHDDYAEMLVDGGVIFIASWLYLLFLTFRHAAQFPWLVGCLAIATHSLSDFPLYRPQIAGLFGFLLGAGTAAASTIRMSRTPTLPIEQFQLQERFIASTYDERVITLQSGKGVV